jgi:outer membrane protein TolC
VVACHLTVRRGNDWVKSFHDSGLEVVVREAIANNLDLRQAAALVDAARQSVIVVGSNHFVSVALDIPVRSPLPHVPGHIK